MLFSDNSHTAPSDQKQMTNKIKPEQKYYIFSCQDEAGPALLKFLVSSIKQPVLPDMLIFQVFSSNALERSYLAKTSAAPQYKRTVTGGHDKPFRCLCHNCCGLLRYTLVAIINH
jgi:hypothetical protein